MILLFYIDERTRSWKRYFPLPYQYRFHCGYIFCLVLFDWGIITVVLFYFNYISNVNVLLFFPRSWLLTQKPSKSLANWSHERSIRRTSTSCWNRKSKKIRIGLILDALLLKITNYIVYDILLDSWFFFVFIDIFRWCN